MILKSLSLQNFLGYRDRTELDFTNKRTVGIVGVNESGKSSLLQAIRYVLYGRSQAEREAQLINENANGHLLVEASFLFDAKGERLDITRGRTKKGEPILKVAGIRGSPQQLQGSINERLKLSHEDFIALTYFVQKDIDQFMSENKRSYFQRWTSTLMVWESIHVEAKEAASRFEARRGKYLIAIKHYEAEAKLANVWAQKESELMVDVQNLNKKIAAVKKTIKEAQSAVERQIEGESLTRQLVKDKAALAEANKQTADYQTTVEEVEQEKRQAESGQCPILNVMCPKLKDHELSGLEKRLQRCLKQAQANQDKSERLEMAVRDLEQVLVKYKKDIQNSFQIKKERRRLETYERTVSKLLVEVGKLRSRKEEAERARRKIEVLTNEVKRLDEKISTARFVAYMCGNSGVPSALIENELSEVESKCNWVLKRLDSAKRVTFRSYKTLGGFERICPKCGSESWMKGTCKTCGLKRPNKVKHEPTVIVRDQFGERPFCLESGGAQTLQSFAVRLACALFVGSMRGVSLDMVMLDEVFAHLDAENRQRLLALIIDKLASEFNLRQQLIVSHHEDVIHAVDDIVEVRKGRNGSTARWL